jgi:lipoprotein-releasing system ATP-binding protein
VFFASKPLGPFTKKEMARYRRFSVGMIFQNFNLIPTMTARENVSLALAFGGLRGQQRRARSSELLARVGLGDRLDHKPSELSGGEQQRVAVARALLQKPDLVLADEPTGNLDTQTGEALFSLMRELNKARGTTFVIVTHNDKLSSQADRIVHMQDGQIV